MNNNSLSESSWATSMYQTLSTLSKAGWTLGMLKGLAEKESDLWYSPQFTLLDNINERGNGWKVIIVSSLFKIKNSGSVEEVHKIAKSALNKLSKIKAWNEHTKVISSFKEIGKGGESEIN